MLSNTEWLLQVKAVSSSEDTVIQVYPFDAAPEELQKLSDNGGDEDFIVIIPKNLKYRNDYFSLFNILAHRYYDYQYIEREKDSVYIFSHA